MFQVLKTWPHIERDPEALRSLNPVPYLSWDLEWNIRDGKPTILGASDGTRTVSVPYEEGKRPFLDLLARRSDTRILGHNVISADLQVAADEGIDIKLENVEDTILWHFLTNMSLCKGTKKSDDEEGEKRGRGFMNLYAACSAHLSVPNWKQCIGDDQCRDEGRPCPKHDVFGYNGNDCYWPLKAFPLMLHRAKLLGVDKLYPLHRDLVAALSKMRARGVYVDVPYVDSLRRTFKSDCENMSKSFPFNPNSPPQVKKYFSGKGIELANAQQATLEEAAEDNDDEELNRLVTYGQLGNGPDRWFAPLKFDYKKTEWEGYVDPSWYIHPNLQVFTSTARLACSNPNLQNIAHRPKKHEKGMDPTLTIQGRIRRSLIAPEDHYLMEADYSNAENRVMLHLAGHSVPDGVDLHSWVAEIAEFKPDDPFCLKEGSPRQAAKTVQHGNFYGEGLSLITVSEYRSSRIQNEISKGVRIAYPDWTFGGQIVTFTGINFARRAFGNASFENRVRANTIIGKLFARFPGVRELQKSISKRVENEKCVRNDFGYVYASYGYPAERIKSALAFTGSNPVAHATKLAILNVMQDSRLDCRLQIHDSLLFYIHKRYQPVEAKKWIKEAMEVDLATERGVLRIPVDVKSGYDGQSWANLVKV